MAIGEGYKAMKKFGEGPEESLDIMTKCQQGLRHTLSKGVEEESKGAEEEIIINDELPVFVQVAIYNAIWGSHSIW